MTNEGQNIMSFIEMKLGYGGKILFTFKADI